MSRPNDPPHDSRGNVDLQGNQGSFGEAHTSLRRTGEWFTVSVMESLNFELLREKHPDLADLGGFAETYVFSDPQSAAGKLRLFCERMVDELYRSLALPLAPKTDLFVRTTAACSSRQLYCTKAVERIQTQRRNLKLGVSADDELLNFLTRRAFHGEL